MLWVGKNFLYISSEENSLLDSCTVWMVGQHQWSKVGHATQVMFLHIMIIVYKLKNSPRAPTVIISFWFLWYSPVTFTVLVDHYLYLEFCKRRKVRGTEIIVIMCFLRCFWSENHYHFRKELILAIWWWKMAFNYDKATNRK